ncbi:ankyrin repeat domain-containing protein 55-like [Asterias amurensis]|uniref:ankyrin repeat domain-containing protein 55-like n=1 Tax=Asterias amurensis TaxID=7602 RepID=UPI003AB215BA
MTRQPGWRQEITGGSMNRYNLAEAAFRGDTNRVQEIMEEIRDNFESVEMKTYNGMTPLMAAAFKGHLDIVNILVLHNTALESRDRDGDTALAYAVHGNQPKIVWYLLDKGSDINTSNKKGMTPINIATCEDHWSCAESIVTHRLGCNVNCRVEMKNYNGKTPLMAAAFKGHLDIVRRLVLHKTELESRDRNGDTALAYAVYGNQPKIVGLLLDEGSDINTSNEKGMTPIHIATCEGHWSCAEKILTLTSGCNVNCRADDRHTPLFYAIKKNEPRFIKCLVQHPDVDIEMADARGFNSLHHAVMEKSQSTVGLILHRAPHMLNIQTVNGFTALHFAAYNDMLDIVSTLAKQVNCKRDLKTVAGDTALHLASSKCHITCIKALIKYGANVNAQDVAGQTSLHLVMMQATMQDGPIYLVDIALYFIENHAEIYIRNNDGKDVLDVTANLTTRKTLRKAYRKKNKACKIL